MKILLLIGLAGFIGSLARFLCSKWVDSWFPSSGFPWGTLAVNIVGSLLAGFLFICMRERFPQWERYFPVLFAGFLGAFTTFSTFMLESSRFLLNAQSGKFVLNLLLQNGTGLLAALAGLTAAKIIFHV